MRSFRSLSLLLLLPAVLGACGDDPLAPGDWIAVTDSVTLYSVSRPELVGLPSAFDFINGIRLPVEDPGASGQWDLALAEQNGELVFAPAVAFEGMSSRARIARLEGQPFETLVRAPGDTLRYTAAPLRVEVGGVYVMRSRRASCQFFGTGSYFAKLEVVRVDPIGGTVTFRAIRNPNCGDRDLVPPDDR